jgi:hypothetical protein
MSVMVAKFPTETSTLRGRHATAIKEASYIFRAERTLLSNS